MEVYRRAALAILWVSAFLYVGGKYPKLKAIAERQCATEGCDPITISLLTTGMYLVAAVIIHFIILWVFEHKDPKT